MSIDEKIACLVNVVFGAGVGVAIHLFALGGFNLLTGRPAQWWNGWIAFLVCVGGGGIIGGLSYKHRHRDFGPDLTRAGIYEGRVGAMLLVRRIGVIVGAVIAVYYMWQLAKSI